MSTTKHLSQADVRNLADLTAARALTHKKPGKPLALFGVPRGGIPAAYAVADACLATHNREAVVIYDLLAADVIIDDLIDSGSTRASYALEVPDVPFLALLDKAETGSGWVVFPWEGSEAGSSEDIILRLLQFIGEDPKRGGLLETPKRVMKAWRTWGEGYHLKPEDVLKTFEDGAENCDQMIVETGIPIYSHCEHHLAPFFGTATIAYIPDGKIVGLSKLSRLANIFARRLQVQERLTNQIGQAMVEHIKPKGVAVSIRCRHLCMESRGICQQGVETTTSFVHGILKEDARARAEFHALAHR